MEGSGIASAAAEYKQSVVFPLLFALVGFVLAQPVYDLVLSSPEFLVARQNTQTDLWLLVAVINGLLPAMLIIVAQLLARWRVDIGRAYLVLLVFMFSAVFLAQLVHDLLGHSPFLFYAVVLGPGYLLGRILLQTRWPGLAWTLALLSLSFPVLFLIQMPQLDYGEGIALPGSSPGLNDGDLPPIVIVLADELPLATLLDDYGEIDQALFPNIYRLRKSSNWYRNTITVSDGTPEAVPAILTGRYPSTANTPATIANAPVNLFTLLQGRYTLNVAEAVTRLCPRSHCPLYKPPGWRRFSALLQDLAALFLHRVVPESHSHLLPDVSYGWSGFFADKQQFFPGGWLEFAKRQTAVNRPAIFRQFIRSVQDSQQPTLNFIHIMYPHVPFAYLPDGSNYGNHWLRGITKETWQDSQWGVLSGKQRHYLQVQHFDSLLGELLDHLQAKKLFDKALLVLVADHGAAFAVNDRRRALSETNAAAILRVPLFIKEPGQTAGRVFDEPVMSIDILPTVLSILGYDHGKLAFDGQNLRDALPSPGRDRQALSFKHREYRSFQDPELDIKPLVRENRQQLALGDPAKALWGIGPLASYRGLPLARLCTPETAKISVIFDRPTPLPGAENASFVPAFVTGRFDGEMPQDLPYPFVLTLDGIIVASGETWQLRGKRLFFAMVEAQFLLQPNHSLGAWLYTPEACLGGTVEGQET